MSQSANPSKYTRRYHPRHPLAQYAITQIDTLELCAQDIVKAMGYSIKYTIPACDRLRHVLSNKHLGLDGSYMDKCFTGIVLYRAGSCKVCTPPPIAIMIICNGKW